MISELNIQSQCIERIKSLPPIKKIGIRGLNSKLNNIKFDGFLDITTEKENKTFIFETKRIIKRPIPEQIYILKKNYENFILFAEYINSSIAENLKKKDINFVDCQGNIYINITGFLYVNIQGNIIKKSKERELTAIFQSKGLQLLFVLLKNDDYLNSTIRKLYPIAGISHGRTVTILKELKEKKYIKEIEKNKWEFTNKKDIFKKWVTNYGERLRPKILSGTYRISEKMRHQVSDILKTNNFKFAFTGGFGAELLTHYYRANFLDIFISETEINEVVSKLKLLPARDYNLRLFNLFSDEIIFKKNNNIAHPLLVYAELVYHGGDRELETAEMIYEQYLKDLF